MSSYSVTLYSKPLSFAIWYPVVLTGFPGFASVIYKNLFNLRKLKSFEVYPLSLTLV